MHDVQHSLNDVIDNQIDNTQPHFDVISTRQTQTINQTITNFYNFGSGLSIDGVVKQEAGLKALDAQKLPDLLDVGDHLKAYRFPKTEIRDHLLRRARSQENCTTMTKIDLEYIVRCCNYYGKFPVIDREELSALSVETLSYIAQNKRKLSEDAINALAKALTSQMKRTQIDAVLGLCYAINNGQNLKANIIATLKNKISALSNEKLPFPNVIVFLQTLAKLEVELTHDQLTFLTKCLSYLEDEHYLSHFPQTAGVLGPLPEDSRRIYRPLVSELLNLLVLVQNNQLLGKDDLSYTAVRFTQFQEDESQELAIDVLKSAIINGQRNLPFDVVPVIKAALLDPNRRIRNDAIIALGYLINDESNRKLLTNSTGPEDKALVEHKKTLESLVKALNSTLNQQRKDAITALCYYITKFGNNKLPPATLPSLMLLANEDHSKHNDTELGNCARFAVYLIKKDIEDLQHALLDKSLCTKASQEFLNAAKRNLLGNKELNMDNLLKVVFDVSYPNEARHNIIATFYHFVKNGRSLTQEIITALIEKGLTDIWPDVCDGVLSILGLYAHNDLKKLLALSNDTFKRLLDCLDKALNNERKAQNASYVLRHIAENIESPCYEQQFSKLLNTASKIFNKKNCGAQIEKHIGLLLAHAAKKGFIFDQPTITELTIKLGGVQNDEIKRYIISSLGFTAQNKNSSETFLDELINHLADLLEDKDAILSNDAGMTLCFYIEKSKIQLPDSAIKKFGTLMKSPKISFIASNIIKSIAKRGWPLPECVLDQLTEALTHGTDDIRINAAEAWKAITISYPLTEKMFFTLQNVLYDKESEVMASAITTLKNSLEYFFKNQQKVTLLQTSCQKLVELVTSHSLKIQTRTDAIMVLASYSKLGQRLPTFVLLNLQKVLNNENAILRRAAVHAIRFQIKYLVNPNNNEDYKAILVSMQNLLRDEAMTEDVIAALLDAVENGYPVWEYVDILDTLAWILYNYLDIQVRNTAKNILKKIKANNLPPKIAAILELEEIGQIVDASDTTDPIRCSAIQKLAAAAKNKNLLTQNNIVSLEKALTENNKNLNHEIITALYLVAKNDQVLTTSVLQSIEKLMASSSCDARNAIAVLAQAAKNGQFIPQSAFILMEKKAEEIGLINEDILIALKIAAERGFSLKDTTITNLVLLLNQQDSNLKSLAAITLCSAGKNHQNFSNVFETLILELENKSIEATKQFTSILKSVTPSPTTSLKLSSLELLIATMKKHQNIDIENNICVVLEKIGHIQELPSHIKDILEAKQQQSTLFNENLSMQHRLEAIKSIKKRGAGFLASTTRSIEKLLQSKQERLIIATLVALSEVKDLNLPISIVDSIAEFLLNQTTHLSAYQCLSNIICEKKLTSKKSQKLLLQVILNHPIPVIRNHAFDLLIKIEQFHKSIYQRQMDLERIAAKLSIDSNYSSQLEDIQTLTSNLNIEKKLLLSPKNIMVLLQLLKNSKTELKHKIIDTFHCAKERINSEFYSLLLVPLLELLNNPNHNQQKIAEICLAFLQSESCSQSHIDQVINILNSHMPLKNNSLHIKLLNEALDRKIITADNQIILSDNVLKNMVNVVLTHEEPKQQAAAINILIKIAKQKIRFQQPVIQPLKKLSHIVYNNKPIELKLGLHKEALELWKKFKFYARGEVDVEKIPHTPSLKNKIYELFCLIWKNQDETFEVCENVLTIISPDVYPWINNKDFNEKIITVTENKSVYRYILATLLGRKSVDEGIFSKNPESWCRELLCLDLFNSFKEKNSEDERKDFYQYLTELEQTKKYKIFNEERDRLLELIIEKQKTEKLDLTQVKQLLLMLKRIDNPIKCLTVNNGSFHYIWLKNSLNPSLSNKLLSKNINKISLGLNNSKWDIELTDIFLQQISDEQDINEIINFLNFVTKYNVHSEKIAFILNQNGNNVKTIKPLWTHLIKDLIKDQLAQILTKDSDRLTMILDRIVKLIISGWSFDKIYETLKILDKTQGNKEIDDQLFEAFDIAYSYAIAENIFFDNNIFASQSEVDQKIYSLHKWAIDQKFQSSGNEKNLETLLEELRSNNGEALNQHNQAIIELLRSDKLGSTYEKMKALYEQDRQQNKGELLSSYICLKPIKEWQISDIQLWANHIKQTKIKQEHLPELLAVIQRACFLHCKYEPRIVQVLAVLALYHSPEKMGRLAQIATGEGKSTIIAMLAVLRALQHEKVDIVTSSPVLAKRDAGEYQAFYKMFNLEVGSNEDESYTSGMKKCYADNIDIVYGDASNFQFDILREEYSLLGTRNKRVCDIVIVDEVDNMLIDDGAKIAMLANTMPAMDQLEFFLLSIWVELQHAKLEIYGNNTADYLAAKDTRKLYCTALKRVFKKFSDNQNPFNVKPKHLNEFFDKQIPNWINSAIAADRSFHLKKDYIIKPDSMGVPCITPVDYDNTGVVLNNTTWGDGIQQFLQIKHGLKISPEGLTTNFLSNMAFIKKYKKTFGLTGTLGSKATQSLLADTYPIDFVHIPTYKTKQFFELPCIIASTEEEWLNETTGNSIREAKHGRTVLIICETIGEAEAIFKKLEERAKKKFSIKLYVQDDPSQGKTLESFINDNNIIVATNLAGRGTDIRTTQDVEKNGGLKVIPTFSPKNFRVEEQAFGRTSRQGKRGTAQLILNKVKLEQQLGCTIDTNLVTKEQLKILREKNEELHLAKIRLKDKPFVEQRDNLFKNFCNLLKELDEFDKDKNTFVGTLRALKIEPGTSFWELLKDKNSKYKHAAVEERWGLWLKTCNQIDENKFAIFKEDILKEYKEDTIIKNPCYYISQANDLMTYANSLKGKILNLGFCDSLYQAAIDLYTNAINLDPIFCYNALYGRACALANQASAGYKIKAKHDLLRAQQLIKQYILPRTNEMMVIHSALCKTAYIPTHGLGSQLLYKMKITQQLQESIDRAIEEIEISEKLIDVSFNNQDEVTSYTKLTKPESLELLKTNQSEKIEVSFYNLKMQTDLWASFQSQKTINKSKQNQDIHITFGYNKQGGEFDKELLKSYLPINKRPPKEVPNETKKIEHNTSNKELKKILGTRDGINFVKDKVSAGLQTVTEKASHGINVVTQKIEDQYQKFIDFLNNLEKAKLLLVSLTVNNLTASSALKMLAKKPCQIDEDLDLIIHNVDKNLIQQLSKMSFFKHAKIISRSINKNSEPSSNSSTVRCLVENIEDTNDLCEISFNGLGVKKARKIALALNTFIETEQANKRFVNLDISLNFSDLHQKTAHEIIDASEGATLLNFNGLTKESANQVISISESHSDTAILTFKNLDAVSATELIEQADRKEENFNVTLQPIENLFPKSETPKSEIQEAKADGLQFLFQLKERTPRPWKSIIFVTAMGLMQIAAGIALAGLTGGFAGNLGISFLGDGLSDLFTALRVIYTCEFDLYSYGAQKALSMVCNLVTAGFASYQMKAANAAAVSAEITNNTLKTSEAVAEVATNVKKTLDGIKLVSKQLGVYGAEMSATEVMNFSIDKIGDVISNQFKEHYMDKIEEQLKICFDKESWKVHLNKLCAVDKFLGNNHYQQKMFEAAGQIIEEMSESAINIELLNLTEFEQKFSTVLEKLTQSIPCNSIETLLQQRLEKHINHFDSGILAGVLKKNKIFNKDDNFNMQFLFKKEINANYTIQDILNHSISSFDCENLNLSNLDFENFNHIKNEIIDACKSLLGSLLEEHYLAKNVLWHHLSNCIAERINGTLDSHFNKAKKAGMAGAKMTVNAVSNTLQSKLHEDGKTFQEKLQEHHSNTKSVTHQVPETNEPKPQPGLIEDDIPDMDGVTDSNLGSSNLTNSKQTQDIELEFSSGNSLRVDSTTTNADDWYDEIPSDDVRPTTKSTIPPTTSPHLVKQFSGSQFNNLIPKNKILNEIKLLEKKISIRDKFVSYLKNPVVKNIARTSLVVLQNQLLAKVQNAIEEHYAEKAAIYRQQLGSLFDQSKQLHDSATTQWIKIIKSLLSFILIENRFSKELRELDELDEEHRRSFDAKGYVNQVVAESDILFAKCLKSPHNALAIVTKYFNENSNDEADIADLLSLLKNYFTQFNQHLEGFKMEGKQESNAIATTGNNSLTSSVTGAISTVISGVKLNEVMNSYFKNLDDQNYTQCGLLLKEGKMGESGFIVGSMIEGMIKCQMTSTQAHARMQLMLTKLAEKMVANQNNFLMEVVNIAKAQQSLAAKIDDNYHKKLDEALKLVIKASESGNDQQMKLAKRFLQTVDKYLESSTRVIEANAIDKEFQSKCVDAHKLIMSSLMDTLTASGAQQTGGLQALIEAGKDMVQAIVKRKSSQNQSENGETKVENDKTTGKIENGEEKKLLTDGNEESGSKPNANADSWKKHLEEGNDLYDKGKFAYKANKFAEANGFFQKAKTKLKEVKELKPKLTPNLEKQLNNRLNYVQKDGKYSTNTLSTLKSNP